MSVSPLLSLPADVALSEIARQWGPEQEVEWLKEEEEYVASLPQNLVRQTIGTAGKGSKFKFDHQVVRCVLRGCMYLVQAEPDVNGGQRIKADILDKLLFGSRRNADGEAVSMKHPCLMDRFPDLDFEHPFRRLRGEKAKRVWIRVG